MANVLVLDDDRALLNLMVTVLQRAGHQVAGLLSASEAEDRLAHGAYDLAIIDLFLEGVRGEEIIKAMRGRHPTMKLIAISGAIGEGAGLGVDLALGKPFRPRALVEAVAGLLSPTVPDR
jgi:DNA-binding response OmpR family regulator